MKDFIKNFIWNLKMKTKIDDNILKNIYLEITKDKGKPLDFWEISALLEIYGIRDIDAKNEYGFENVFEMGKYLEKFKNIKTYPNKPLATFEEVPNFYRRVIKNYIKGLAFAMPMLVQIFFTLVVGYAIWSGMDMGKTKATVIALGTFLALLITGGSAQAIGRKGLFYIKQNQFILASNVTKELLKMALIITFLTGIFFIVINTFFEILPTYYFFVLISFYFLLSILFLNVSVFQMFEEYNTILIFFLIGIIFVYFFHSVYKIGLPEAQFLALVILNIIISFYTYKKLEQLKLKLNGGEGEEVPRSSIMFYTLIPFYLYGFFYFSFLIADKIIAWSVNIKAKPYFIWFDVPYELGVDWALIALIILMGMAEVSIYEFMYRINENVTKFKYSEYKKFNNKIKTFYNQFNLVYIVFSFITIISVYYIIYGLNQLEHIQYLEDFIKGYTPFVYWIAALSYALLVHSLINVLFIFSFSRQTFALKSIFLATLVNIIFGLILSRGIALEYSVIGLLVGAIVFWYYSFRYTMHMFNNLEFYYYSAI